MNRSAHGPLPYIVPGSFALWAVYEVGWREPSDALWPALGAIGSALWVWLRTDGRKLESVVFVKALAVAVMVVLTVGATFTVVLFYGTLDDNPPDSTIIAFLFMVFAAMFPAMFVPFLWRAFKADADE